MPKLDLSTITAHVGSSYPAPHDAEMGGRAQQRLGEAAGLTQFGANLVRLAPGGLSSLRHWHEQQDEFLVVTEGALVLIDDTGETALSPGDCCAFPAGDANGHHIANRSDADAAFVVVGTRTDTETAWYSDLDMKVVVNAQGSRFLRRDGAPMSSDASSATPEHTTFDDLSKALSRALVSGDFALYRSVFHLPHDVIPRSGDAYTLRTEAEIHEDFDLYHAAIMAGGITRISRKILSQTEPDPDTRLIEAEVTMRKGEETLVTPFTTTFRMERRKGRWAFGRVISSLGHINWTRGQGAITQNRRFELD